MRKGIIQTDNPEEISSESIKAIYAYFEANPKIRENEALLRNYLKIKLKEYNRKLNNRFPDASRWERDLLSNSLDFLLGLKDLVAEAKAEIKIPLR